MKKLFALSLMVVGLGLFSLGCGGSASTPSSTPATPSTPSVTENAAPAEGEKPAAEDTKAEEKPAEAPKAE